MAVGVLIITHGEIGEQLMMTAASTLGGEIPLPCKALSITQSCDPDQMAQKANDLLESLNQGQGVLVLTDMYGSTPSNIANKLKQLDDVNVIAGVNLPMLIRVLNYPELNRAELIEKALSGGHDGIMLCQTE